MAKVIKLNTRGRDRRKKVTKLCLTCFKELSSRISSSKYCDSKCRSTWRRNNEPSYKERQYKMLRDYQKKVQNIVYDYYGNKCNCCGETERLFLSLDHVNNDGNKEKNRNTYSICLKIIRDNFPNKFQILCMNCNHGKSRNNGICPHKLSK